MASIEFRFPVRPSWDQATDVFVTSVYQGEPAESSEVAPRWFTTDALPLAKMWDDAKYWLPLVLAGERVDVLVTFADDCATVARMVPDLATGKR
jgi:8-oxo-dGTP diphosphatase